MQAKHEGVCKGCAKGKNTKNTFPSIESKEKGILEIIHFDVCGPMSSSSLSRYVYYVSFIYDFSCKTWIYFLKGKKMRYSASSSNSKPWLKITLRGRSRLYSQIMAENSPQKNSSNFVESLV